MKLYSYYRSSSSYRVRIGLALKGIPHEYVAVNIAPTTKAQNAEPFGSVNPMRQVPVLEWMEAGLPVRLTQSVAILEYLEERWPNPSLLPQDALARARVREAVEIVNAGIQPLQNTKLLEQLRVHASAEVEERWRNDAISQGLSALEAHALRQSGPFFLGSEPSMADLFIVPQLYNARRYGIPLHAFPRLTSLEAHALSHPAFRSAHPDAQPDAPPAPKE